MKKKLRFSLLMLLLAVFNISGFADTKEISLTSENVSDSIFNIVFDKGNGSNAPKYYDKNPIGVRLYAKGTLTISAKDEIEDCVITKIEYTFKTNANKNGIAPTPTLSSSVGELTTTDDGGIWTGTTNQPIVLTADGSAGNLSFTALKIEYTMGGETPVIKENIAKINGLQPQTMVVGDIEEFVLDATFAANTVAGEDYEVTYSTDNTDILEIADNMVEAKAEGTANVTVLVTVLDDEKYNEVSKTFAINVKASRYETVELPYEETLVNSQGKFAIEDVKKGGLDAIWKTSKYGMTANGYKCTDEVESWFVSPIIDATNETSITLTFEQNICYFADTETAKNEATLWVREGENGTWNQLTIPNFENVSNNNLTSAGNIDLSEYAGKTLQLGFKYTATAAKAGRWEIKNLSVAAEQEVQKQDPELSYSENSFTAILGEDNELPTLSNPNNLDVTYSSSNTEVATVGADGVVTIVNIGQTTVKATFEGDDNYSEGEASYTLTVKKPAPTDGDKYKWVTSVSDLNAGDEIIIVYVDTDDQTDTTTGMTLGTTQNTNNRNAVKVTINDDETITPTDETQVITLEEGYYLNVGNGYLYAAGSSNSGNYLKTKDNADDKAKANITIDDNGIATIQFGGYAKSNTIAYNANNGSPLFSCYNNPTSLPRIYKKMQDKETISVTIGSTGYSTLYYGEKSLLVPSNMEAYTYTVVDGKLEESYMYEAGEVIPAGTGVVLKAEAGNYTFEITTTDDIEVDTDNMLRGSDTDELTEGDNCKFYMLSLNADKDPQSVGFYFAKGCPNGEAFTNKAHKAYLAVPEGMAVAKAFMLNGDTDGIEESVAESTNGDVFTLSGIRIGDSNMQKGIYVKNGKKFIVK